MFDSEKGQEESVGTSKHRLIRQSSAKLKESHSYSTKVATELDICGNSREDLVMQQYQPVEIIPVL